MHYTNTRIHDCIAYIRASVSDIYSLVSHAYRITLRKGIQVLESMRTTNI